MTSTQRIHRPLAVLVALMAVLAVIAAVGLFTDPRILTGAPIWAKPFKFSISILLYAGTIAWILAHLPRPSRIANTAATVISAVLVIEMAVIVGQVLRGQASHYNESTPLNAALWQVMGSSIMILFAAHVVFSIMLLRRRLADPVVTVAVRLGLALSLLGLLAAVPMVMPHDGVDGAHSVGVADGGPGLPLLGWSTVGGDLRIGHFVGLHGLQALPLLAMLLIRFAGTRLGSRTVTRLLLVAGAAYAALTVMLTWQALRAQPLLKPDAMTLAVFGALVIATAVAAVSVIARDRRVTAQPGELRLAA
jgi:hypothetical protein